MIILQTAAFVPGVQPYLLQKELQLLILPLYVLTQKLFMSKTPPSEAAALGAEDRMMVLICFLLRTICFSSFIIHVFYQECCDKAPRSELQNAGCACLTMSTSH